ncbi:MAG: ABC transporter substrate-binding protein, partial [Lachnospiraceae bacterium]|nr:ABC transporter substrate-binding protein [Lachnospiraceae bacterium]
MKKIFCLFLTILIVMGTLIGCGSPAADTKKGGSQASSGKTAVVLNEVAHSIFYAPMYVAIEEGYFAEEGIDLTLVTGFGADKTMTALLTDEADIGFMGSESTIYTYKEGASDYAVNFAQLTQRAGNFLVSREPVENFSWDMLKGKDVLGGRAGGMPYHDVTREPIREIYEWTIRRCPSLFFCICVICCPQYSFF